jgi:ADP-heptose:LPS heptosyltransferase
VAVETVALRALGLGDLLTAVPALRALARAFPEHHHVLATSPGLAPLVDLIGSTDRVISSRPLQPLSRIDRPALAVNLHGRGPESHRVLQALQPDRLIAFADIAGGHDGPDWRADEHEVQRWCRLLDESGIPADPNDLDLPRPTAPVPLAARGAVMIHPGAASEARRWPAARWAAVAKRLSGDGASVVVTGSRDERSLTEAVVRMADLERDADLAGRTDLVELAGVVAASRCVLSGDTGLAHLATAFRTPSVTVFGPTSPQLWGPPADRPWHRALWSGSVGDPHADLPDPGLLLIKVDDVVEATGQLPTRPSA